MSKFANDGFGWFCLDCSKQSSPSGDARLMNEGEAESKLPELSEPSMAKWADSRREELVCPKCGGREAFSD